MLVARLREECEVTHRRWSTPWERGRRVLLTGQPGIAGISRQRVETQETVETFHSATTVLTGGPMSGLVVNKSPT